MAREILIGGKPLLTLRAAMAINSDSPEYSEYVALVDWVRQVPAAEAKMKRKAGIYTTQHVRAALDGQASTVSFLESEFGVTFADVLV